MLTFEAIRMQKFIDRTRDTGSLFVGAVFILH